MSLASAEHFDAIVLGTGGVGSAAIYHLAQRGNHVLGLDSHPPGHDRGSSHGETRVIRQAYFEHSDYVPLAIESYRLWKDLEQTTGSSLLRQTGLLQVGPPMGTVLSGVFRSANEHGLTVMRWSDRQAAERFPQFRIPAGMAAAFEPAAGYLLVEDCVRAHIAAARKLGAAWRKESAIDWFVKNDRVQVRTERANYLADRLIITAGAWCPTMLPLLQDRLTVLAKRMYWYSVTTDMGIADGCPVYLFEDPEGIFYGFPSLDGHIAKVAEHSGGTQLTCERMEEHRGVEPSDQDRVDAFLQRTLPNVRPPALRSDTCFYTMSPDGHFIVGRHPEFEAVFLAAGLSGHGFKFTPILGKALADLVCDGKTDLPVGFLSPNRFR